MAIVILCMVGGFVGHEPWRGGMCWAGGLYFSEGDADNKPDLTSKVSQQLDKAKVYGLKTEANSLSFYNSGDFSQTFYVDNSKWGRHERAFYREWTVSSYDYNTKKTITDDIYKIVRLTLMGDINVTDIPKYQPIKFK